MQLEAIRGFAAAYVVLHHAHLSDRPVIKVLLSFGQEAVILFFLLSGFVIYYASHRRGMLLSFGTYFNHRFRRIYPTFVIGLGLAYVASSVLATAWRPIGLAQLGGNLIMLQDISSLKRGVWFDTYAGNNPLWSLSYEWWFYMMFYPIVSVRSVLPQRRREVAFLLSVIGFLSYQTVPNQISLFLGYFFIWWTGVEMSHEYTSSGTITWMRQFPTVLMLAFLVILWALPVGLAATGTRELRFGVDPILQLRHFAAAFAFLVIGIEWYQARFVGFRLLLGPFAVLAPVSYSVYVIHMPVMRLVSMYRVKGSLVHLAVVCAILLPVCYLIEVVAQRQINRWFDRLLVRSEV